MNTGLKKFENTNVDNFTSQSGMDFRKSINPVWRKILRLATKKKVHVEEYPTLDKNKQYIFVCNHSFDEDVISILSTIDRNAYVLNGSTDQTEHNPQFIALWANGMIYVDRQNEESRKSSVDKMNRVLNNGNSVMLFAEGGYNNSENKLITPLFNSPYMMSKINNIEVVPMIAFNEFGSDDIYIRVGEPIKLYEYEKYEAGEILRDAMATKVYEIMLDHTSMIKRSELYNDLYERIQKVTKIVKGDKKRAAELRGTLRDLYMEIRKLAYQSQKWYGNVWEEELTVYSGHGVTTPEDAIKYVDDINVTAENVWVLAPVLARREENEHYNLKKYLSKNMPIKK